VLTLCNTVHCKELPRAQNNMAAVSEDQSADLCNTVHCRNAATSVQQTWAAVSEDQVLTLCNTAHCKGTLQEAYNKHGSCARGSGVLTATL
jgi:hypothetical protein